MVGALRELVELLLTEIAISGTAGTRLADIWALIKTFYDGKSPGGENEAAVSNSSLDRALQEDLWEWLTLNPEVSVGKDKKYNALSLSEAEQVDAHSPDFRLFVSEDRTWKALTGHDKDESKVPAAEFVLLSIIASCRSEGILQTELVRRSGQDGRSVPKRTDALKNKGYIDKRQVQAKAAKTSLCVFSRFIPSAGVDVEAMDLKSMQPREMIDLDAFIQSIFHVLKKHQIISRNDLKDELDFNDSWRRRILSRTIRKFEAIGCVKRVKARSQFHESMNALHPCILLVREPTESDMKLFKNDYSTLFSAKDQENEDAEEQADMQASDHTRIKWNPDVNVPNLIATLIKESGTKGRTNAQVIREGFGMVFRRPSEHTLNRITEGWQISQPSHLKHSAIVRDIAIHGTVTHYLHYAYPHFKELVDSGRADWEAVTFRPRNAKSSKFNIPHPDTPPLVDEDGLAPWRLPKKGVAERDHYCLVSAKGLDNYSVTKSDPVPVINDEGQFVATFQREYGFSSGSRFTPNTFEAPRWIKQRTQDEVPSSPHYALDATTRSLPMTKAEKIDAELRKGIRSAKEIYAAFGMDESWTHVAVELIERKAPGVYMTAKGKGRPLKKRQGRPRESRIAIFKSATLVAYLKSLPQTVPDTPVAVSLQATPVPEEKAPPIIALGDNAETAEPGLSSPALPETPTAQRRSRLNPINASTASSAPTPSLSIVGGTASEAHATAISPREKQETNFPQTEEQLIRVTPQRNHLQDIKAEPKIPAGFSTTFNPTTAHTLDDNTDPTQASKSETPVLFSKSRRLDREGSVARLRRTIVMELIEKAGGAFPAGTELWYAFATVWMKRLNYSEKPDSRTVKSVVKHLIDAGKLRQMTFSGKGPKGFMITRSIIMRPDTNPSSSLVMKLKEELLASGFYVPENIEIDAEVSRLIRGITGAPTGIYSKPVPVEPAITVNLRNKPAALVAQERRREESLQKRLMKPIRLMGLKRKGKQQALDGITSFSRPGKKTARAHPTHLDGHDLFGDVVAAMDIDVPESASGKRSLHRTRERPSSEIKRRKHRHDGSGYGRFLNQLDDITDWELQNSPTIDFDERASLTDHPHGNSRFIHHTVHQRFEEAPIPDNLYFVTGDKRSRVSEQTATSRSRIHEERPSERPSMTLSKLKATKNFTDNAIPDGLPAKPTSSQPSPPVQAPGLSQILDTERPPPLELVSTHEQARPRRKSQLPGRAKKRREQSTETIETLSMTRRRRRGVKQLSSQLVERMKYAIIVVRTIAGGTQGKTVDWDLLLKSFPDEDPQVIQENGKLLLNRERRQLVEMQDQFRVKLLAEYRKKKPALPSIDFNNLASLDWNAVVTWATTQYYAPSARDIPNLPGTRAQFNQYFAHHPDPFIDDFDSIYTAHPSISIVARAKLYSSRPFVITLGSEADHLQKGRPSKREASKSWILSNIVANEETYNAADARAKLSRFPEDLIEDSIKDLTRDRFISQTNRGRIVPGRNFNFTETFNQSFGRKRAIDKEMIKQASRYKRVLDEDFKRDGMSQIRYNALDGEVLAIMALASEGRVHILPNDPPANAFGMTEGNYETRALDKVKFKFQVDVVPDHKRYEYGDPVRRRISTAPMAITDEEINQLFDIDAAGGGVDSLPLWVDINGNVREQLWQSIVSSIVGVLAIRPKLDMKGIYEQFQGYLSLQDIERVLKWLEAIDLARKEDSGGNKDVWSVKEYWWMLLG